MAKAIKTKHTFTLSSGQVFTVEAHYRNVPRLLNKKGDSRAVSYIETLSNDTPNVKDAELYHAWKLTDGQTLSAWYIPENTITAVTEL